MTDFGSAFARLPNEHGADPASREERHQLLAMLLGAFADGELPAETASQIDAHLLGCTRCRRELQVHQALRLRLEQEPVHGTSPAFRDRISAAIANAPAPAWEATARAAAADAPAPVAVVTRRSWTVPLLRIIALVLVIAMVGRLAWPPQRTSPLREVSLSSQPLLREVMSDFQRVTVGDLPGRARDLAAVRAAVPFPVQPMQSPSLRLLAAWTTALENEPAAVLAYRWHDQLVLEYIVADQQLYRPASLRAALADGGTIAGKTGAIHLVGWPRSASASLVVGALPATELAALREDMVAR